MRVVQVSWHLDPHRRAPAELIAAWPTLVDAAAAAARAGVDVTVVQAAHEDAVIEREGVRFDFVRAHPPPQFLLPVGPWASPVSARILARVADLRPDVLHQHGLTHPLHARALIRQDRGVPLLVQDHASRPPGLLRRVYRSGFRDISAVAFTAHAQAGPFIEAGVFRRDVPVFELLEGSTHFVPRDPAGARARTGLTGSPCLLWVGHLDRNKDPLTVLRAFAWAVRLLPDARLWLAYGTSPLRAEVETFIAQHGLARHVTLIGSVEHAYVEWLLSAADFLVQASRFEGSGYAVLEALACGVTPIVTDIPSFRRMTRAGEVGALAPVGDADAFGRAIVELAARDGAMLRARARAHFDRSLSFDVVGAELRAAYATLAATVR